ncbi:MAG: hypothetical protein LBI88_03340 [Deltaproteobacteria bacterium]|nr:hypothetical protein [Deltaproteobacteria bacterium]
MITPNAPTGGAINMDLLADKMRRGSRFTDAEQSIVMSTASQIYASALGPGPADMRLTPVQLPENVKGILARFSL